MAGEHVLSGLVQTIGDTICSNNDASLEFVSMVLCVGISNKESQNEFSVFPNPVSSGLNVQLNESENAIVQIVTMEGVEVSELKINDSSVFVPVIDLENGFYLIKIINENGVFSQKFEVSK